MPYQILVINPGSTSLKLALYEDERELWRENVPHTTAEIARYKNTLEQLPMRMEVLQRSLKAHGTDISALSCVVGRGGMLPPVLAGGYIVNEQMAAHLKSGRLPDNASNLGGLLALEVAKQAGACAYIYDAVSSDEMDEVARITGIAGLTRHSYCHVLNSKAKCRELSARLGGRYEDYRFIVAHLGGGISLSAHRDGKIIDSIPDDGGPFSPERSGSVPLRYVVDMCFSGKYSKGEISTLLRGMGGLKALLGTHDLKEIEKMVGEGDPYASLVYEAQAYQVAKGIGELSPTLCGQIDAIILTGGLAYSAPLCDKIKKYVSFIAKIEVMPGENELLALALGALRILRGEETAHDYDLSHNLEDVSIT